MRFEERTPIATVRLALRSAQVGLACISDAVLRIDSANVQQTRYELSLGRTHEAGLGGRLSLGIYEEYSVSGARAAYVAERVAYRYRLMASERELLAYHWNPAGPEGRPFPHLHLSAAAEVGNRQLTRAHIPTGEVALRDVVTLLIGELGVRPRRADWRQVLASPPLAPDE